MLAPALGPVLVWCLLVVVGTLILVGVETMKPAADWKGVTAVVGHCSKVSEKEEEEEAG